MILFDEQEPWQRRYIFKERKSEAHEAGKIVSWMFIRKKYLMVLHIDRRIKIINSMEGEKQRNLKIVNIK